MRCEAKVRVGERTDKQWKSSLMVAVEHVPSDKTYYKSWEQKKEEQKRGVVDHNQDENRHWKANYEETYENVYTYTRNWNALPTPTQTHSSLLFYVSNTPPFLFDFPFPPQYTTKHTNQLKCCVLGKTATPRFTGF